MREPDKTKDIKEMSLQDFYHLPQREQGEDIGHFDALIILPALRGDENNEALCEVVVDRLVYGVKNGHLHDSGYRLMDFVAVKGGHPMCRLSGVSDVLHINGIGGYGKKTHECPPSTIPVQTWSIDCLPKSGLLRLWCSRHQLSVNGAFTLSDFEIFSIHNKGDANE